jgi:hypothetical protein
MPRKRVVHIQVSAHDQLDQLRQQVGAEGVKLRELDVALEAAKRKIEDASNDIAFAYVEEDEKLAAQRRKALETAEDEIADIGHRRAAAQVRVERAQEAVRAFTEEHAAELLKEREDAASETAKRLTHAVHEAVQLNRQYAEDRQGIQDLVNVITPGDGQMNGPLASHSWEEALKDLARLVRQTPELPPPLPRWLSKTWRQREDKTAQRIQEQRRRQLKEAA